MERPDITLRALTSYRLRRTTVAVMAQFNQVFAEFGLRRTTFSALTLVVDNPGLRQSQLADALAIERPNLVQLLDELEAEGLVRRVIASDDRRAYALHPTPKGQRLHARAMAAARACDVAMTRDLTKDQITQLHDLLSVLQGNAQSTETHDVRDLSKA